MVEIAIKDTGCGIPEANLQRIFDPFFTSKEVGKGQGWVVCQLWNYQSPRWGNQGRKRRRRGDHFSHLSSDNAPFAEIERNTGRVPNDVRILIVDEKTSSSGVACA